MSGSLRFRIAAPPAERDALVGALHSLGCLGAEERGAELWAYFSRDTSEQAVLALSDADRRVHVRAPEPVPDEDWERSWRAGLAPRRIAGLWLRPSWCESAGEPELIIDPQQAFGSGEHASTRLALGLMEQALRRGDRVLDVGSGSGILGLAALRLGAGFVCGFDVDPVATRNADENRARNGLPLALYTGTLAALAPATGFDLVVANMLAGRLAPLARRLATHARRTLVVSGLLESEVGRQAEALAALGLGVVATASEVQSGDTWCALCLTHTRSRQ